MPYESTSSTKAVDSSWHDAEDRIFLIIFLRRPERLCKLSGLQAK